MSVDYLLKRKAEGLLRFAGWNKRQANADAARLATWNGGSMISGHGLSRAEWERRFAYRIATRGLFEAPTEAGVLDVAYAEMESWPVDQVDWLLELPEDAADEQMEAWAD